MKRLIVTLSFLVVACAKPNTPDPRTVVGVDPILQPYLNYYIKAKGSSLSYDIPIGFSVLALPTIGVCTRWSNGYRQIQIDPTFWNSASTTDNQRLSLILHELGHCDLNREHITTLTPDGFPVTLMYPFDVGFMDSQLPYYLQELFNPSMETLASHDLHDELGCVKDIKVESTGN